MDARLVSGTKLGPFVLERKLAIGGMAEIWSAQRHHRDGTATRLALKILQATYSKDTYFRAMFQDEVNLATRLTHENIVRVFGAHDVDGQLFQSMELIDGKDIRRVLSSVIRAQEVFPVPYALMIAREVARGLTYAHHKRGDDGKGLDIIHRDVSPHNIMLATDGSVKILDFGIAKAAERLVKTRTGVVKGKVAYMAPEQALAVGVTQKTDIFALGVVLWEMLAMERLFAGENDAETLDRVIRADAPPIQEKNAGVPPEAAELIGRMLAQRAPFRPDSMQVVERELERVLNCSFREDAVSKEALAAWAAPFLEEIRQATRASPVSDLAPTDPTEVPVVTEPSRTVSDRTDESDTRPEPVPFLPTVPISVSGAVTDPKITTAAPSFLEANDDGMTMPVESVSVPPRDTMPDHVEPAIADDGVEALAADKPSQENLRTEQIRVRAEAPTVGIAAASSPATAAEADMSDETPDGHLLRPQKIRLPHKSEIIRAVEAVDTDPVVLPEGQPPLPPPGRIRAEDTEDAPPEEEKPLERPVLAVPNKGSGRTATAVAAVLVVLALMLVIAVVALKN